MTAVLKASDWRNCQLSSVMQLNSREALCMDYHVCTSSFSIARWGLTPCPIARMALYLVIAEFLRYALHVHTGYECQSRSILVMNVSPDPYWL